MIKDNLKRIREKNKIGLNELSRISGVNASYISAIERGEKTNPSAEILEKLANALHVSIPQFFIDEHSYSIELLTAMQRAIGNKYEPVSDERFITFISKELDIDEEELYKVYNDKSLDLPIDLQKKLIHFFYDLDPKEYINFKYGIKKMYYSNNPEDISNETFKMVEDVGEDTVNKYEFSNPQEALQFILKQPSFMAYGGYDFNKMADEEILEIANDMLFAMKLSLEKIKRKSR